jgi:hypothetical protein
MNSFLFRDRIVSNLITDQANTYSLWAYAEAAGFKIDTIPLYSSLKDFLIDEKERISFKMIKVY